MAESNIDPAIVEALRAHQTIATGLHKWCCKCTPMEWRPVVRRSEHVATALAPLIAAAVDAARAEAWDEAHDTFCPQGPVCSAHQPRSRTEATQ